MMAQESRAERSAGESLSCGMHKIIIHKTLPLYSTIHSCVCVCVRIRACVGACVHTLPNRSVCAGEGLFKSFCSCSNFLLWLCVSQPCAPPLKLLHSLLVMRLCRAGPHAPRACGASVAGCNSQFNRTLLLT